jgi:DNA-binding beta-propeller fold protein YncE
VIDVLNARAQVFSNSGKFIRIIGGQGVVAGKLFRPKGVAVDHKDNIYISDSYMELIQVFDSDGKFLYVLGDQDKIRRFSAPAGIAIYKDRLYVSEVLGNKVSVYSLR